MTMFLLVTTILSVPSFIVSMVMVYLAMFEARQHKYINAYVCIMHMVDAMSTPGIAGVWLTILQLMSDFQD
jgi:uncharacterized membrane protein